MLQGNLGHFLCCQTMAKQISPALLPSAQFAEKVNMLSVKFSQRCDYFEACEGRFEQLSNPFAIDMESAPISLQIKLIEPQCNDILKSKYDSVGAAWLPCFLPATKLQLRTQGAQMCSMFSSTYLREQLFSTMKLNKTSHRTCLTDEYLHSILRLSSAQSLSPDIDELASKKRCQACLRPMCKVNQSVGS